MESKFSSLPFILALLVLWALPSMAWAQKDLQGLSFGEFKERIITMAKEKQRPFAGIPVEDVQSFVTRFTRPDPDLWGAEWMKLGEPHEKKGMELIRQGQIKDGRDALLHAGRYYFVGRFPGMSSPLKVESYSRQRKVFMAAAPYLEFPFKRITIPFKGPRGNEIVGYLQLPKGDKKFPLVIFCGGADGWKEERVRDAVFYLRKGLATFSMDLPGTGESPLYHSPEGHKGFSLAIDYLQTRSEIDSKRIVFVGGSQGGYYAAKMAFVEKARLRACVDHGGPVHYSHLKEWQEKALNTNEYLMDFFITRTGLYGVKTREEYYVATEAMSLKTQGYIGTASCPLLAINGKLDTLNSIGDVYILLEGGPTIRSAWINPLGYHMGETQPSLGPGDPKYTAAFIRDELIVPWLLEHVK